MKLKYNVTGAKRKSLVGAISQVLNAPTKYLGAPTFSYEVGSYHIDKIGTLTGPENLDLENALRQNGFEANNKARHDDDNFELVIEMPRFSFTDTALINLKRLIGSKESLIKKALGVETLEIEITDDKVKFPWFKNVTDPFDVKAYTHFVAALCEMARVQSRVSAKEKDTGNDKYAFRCFLLRLGFIRDKYKQERKILLRNLTSSSAFRSTKSEVTSNEE